MNNRENNDNENNKIKIKTLQEIIEEHPDNSHLKEIIYNNSASKIINLFRSKASKKNNPNLNNKKNYMVKLKEPKNIITNKNTLKKNNNYTYMGINSIDSTKEGFGIQKWEDGSKFVGYFKNDKSNGYGKFIDNQNNYLLGNFKDDKLKGFGIYLNNNEIKYIGEWNNDLQDGIGIEYWKDGAIYTGEFYKGKKNGIGEYIWGDGSKYDGEWENNCLCGYGIYSFSNGEKIYFGNSLIFTSCF